MLIVNSGYNVERLLFVDEKVLSEENFFYRLVALDSEMTLPRFYCFQQKFKVLSDLQSYCEERASNVERCHQIGVLVMRAS